MKVALLLSGLPRMVRTGYEKTWVHIIDKYDTDVYLHAWKDDSWGCDWNEVKNVYNFDAVKSLRIQSPFKFTEYKTGISLPHTDKSRPLPEYDVMSCFRQLPMFYSWQKVYRDCADTTIKYDCIIRSRYDMELFNTNAISSLDLGYLNMGPGGIFYDDNLCVTGYTNAQKIYKNIFDNLIENSRKTGVLNSAEKTWTDIINQSGCSARVEPSLGFKLLRENMLWWAE